MIESNSSEIVRGWLSRTGLRESEDDLVELVRDSQRMVESNWSDRVRG